MSNPVRLRGEAPFPQAGEGVVLRYTNQDCEQLQKMFGDDWFNECVQRLNRFDMAYIRGCIEVGGKKGGKPHIIPFLKLDCTVSELAQVVLDALFLAMHGRTFEDYIKFLDEQAKTKDDEGNSSSPEKS